MKRHKRGFIVIYVLFRGVLYLLKLTNGVTASIAAVTSVVLSVQ